MKSLSILFVMFITLFLLADTAYAFGWGGKKRKVVNWWDDSISSRVSSFRQTNGGGGGTPEPLTVSLLVAGGLAIGIKKLRRK